MRSQHELWFTCTCVVDANLLHLVRQAVQQPSSAAAKLANFGLIPKADMWQSRRPRVHRVAASWIRLRASCRSMSMFSHLPELGKGPSAEIGMICVGALQ